LMCNPVIHAVIHDGCSSLLEASVMLSAST
jgi:hypothetical protein